MESWKQAFKEYNQNLKESLLILLKSFRGLCTGFGMTWFMLCLLGQDIVTGEWYIAARYNDLIANLGGGFKGEISAFIALLFLIWLGNVTDTIINKR